MTSNNGKLGSAEAEVIHFQLDAYKDNLRQTNDNLREIAVKVDEQVAMIGELRTDIALVKQTCQQTYDALNKKENWLAVVLKNIGWLGLGIGLVSSPQLLAAFLKLLGH